MPVRTFTVILAFVLFVSCGREPPPLPQGSQTVRGYIEAVPFSLKRRGTHVLRTESGGAIVFYIESREVNLRSLEGKTVSLTGTLERNIDPVLQPALVVRDVEQGAIEIMKAWEIPALNLSLRLPNSWQGVIRGNTAEFTSSALTVPALKISLRHRPSSGSPSNPAAGTETFYLGSYVAFATLDSSAKSWTVRIEDVSTSTSGSDDLVLAFAIDPAPPSDSALERLREIVRGIRIGPIVRLSSSSSMRVWSSASDDGSSAGEGTPCGGAAGILCPKGFYCQITDVVVQAGICAKK